MTVPQEHKPAPTAETVQEIPVVSKALAHRYHASAAPVGSGWRPGILLVVLVMHLGLLLLIAGISSVERLTDAEPEPMMVELYTPPIVPPVSTAPSAPAAMPVVQPTPKKALTPPPAKKSPRPIPAPLPRPVAEPVPAPDSTALPESGEKAISLPSATSSGGPRSSDEANSIGSSEQAAAPTSGTMGTGGTGTSTTSPRFGAAYLNNPPPAYPASARRMGEQGRVLLRVLVGANGLAKTVRVYKSSGSGALDDAAVKAVRGWRFIPAKRGDKSVEAWVQVPIDFKLN